MLVKNLRKGGSKISNTLILVNKSHSVSKDYRPHNLRIVEVPFVEAEISAKRLMQEEAAQALESLFAKEDRMELYAVSAYRSYQRQELIFQEHAAEYGLEEANQVSAKPGESEHQTGLAVDLTSPAVDFKLSKEFGETKEGQWLQEYAPEFGFIIRYPAGKEKVTGYQYEPWHLRYIGKDAALEIENNNLTLEEYLR